MLRLFSYTRAIAPFVNAELEKAHKAQALGHAQLAFTHLENAHILGQASTYWHVLSHWKMLQWAMTNQQPAELAGQLLRIVGAATKTAIGWVPAGNTGGSNISPFQTIPIPPRLNAIIQQAKLAAR